jgi:gluconolactonase
MTPQQPEFETLAWGYQLVEGPTAQADGGLIFSDVLGGGVYRLAPSGEVTTVVPKRRGVGGIALHADGGLVLGGRDIVHVKDGHTRLLFGSPELAGWNDLCTDSRGRVYAGALRYAVFDPEAEEIPAECFRIDAEGRATALYTGIRHANGIALSPDERTLYHSDTRASAVVVHDLDADGAASNRRAFPMQHGHPDGLACDEDGGIWVASAGGARVDRYRPDGSLERSVAVPAKVVTSVCFAGEDRRDLIVVSHDNSEHPERRGSIFRTRVDVAGAPVHPARI